MTSSSLPQEPSWIIVVDGVHVFPAGNVSEAYNDLFRECVLVGISVFSATSRDAIAAVRAGRPCLIFEIGLWPEPLLKWFEQAAEADTCTVPWAAFVDDVEFHHAAVTRLGNRAYVGAVTPYPDLLLAAQGAVSPPWRTLWLPHGVAQTFMVPVPDLDLGHDRAVRCLLWGQQDRARYPGRAWLASRTPRPHWLRVLDPPLYGFMSGPCLRVAPAVLSTELDACTSCFAGGDTLHVFTSKHWEAAARGVCVLAHPNVVAVAATLGLHFHACDAAAEAAEATTHAWDTFCTLVHKTCPGLPESRNVACIRASHTCRHRAAQLKQWLGDLCVAWKPRPHVHSCTTVS
jgi:hypothetical protein